MPRLRFLSLWRENTDIERFYKLYLSTKSNHVEIAVLQDVFDQANELYMNIIFRSQSCLLVHSIFTHYIIG